MTGDRFVALIVLLQLGAMLAYLWQRKYREAGVWAGAAVSNAAYLSMVRL